MRPQVVAAVLWAAFLLPAAGPTRAGTQTCAAAGSAVCAPGTGGGGGGASLTTPGTDNQIVRVDGTLGIQPSSCSIDDNGILICPNQNALATPAANAAQWYENAAAVSADCTSAGSAGLITLVDANTAANAYRVDLCFGATGLSGFAIPDTGLLSFADDQVMIGTVTGGVVAYDTIPTGPMFYDAATNDISNQGTITAWDTGVTIGVVDQIQWAAAACNAGVAAPLWNTPASNAPAAACYGSTIVGGVLDFDAATDESAETTWVIPASASSLTTASTFRIIWHAAATTGNVIWCLQAVCASNDDPWDTTFSTADCVTDAALGTTNETNIATISNASNVLAGCAAQDVMQLKLFRDADAGGDTMSGDARLEAVSFEFRRAQ